MHNNTLFKDESALYYECGYSCDNALLLTLGSERFFITDGRYEEEAKAEVKGCEVRISRDLLSVATELIAQNSIKSLQVDPKEFDYYFLTKLKEDTRIEYILEPNLSQKKRLIKSTDEIAKLQKAVKLGKRAFKAFKHYAESYGIGEDEVALHYAMQGIMSYQGQYPLSFEPIVAINASASKPHAKVSKTTLAKGDLLLVDSGLKFERYCSDRTRTYAVGKKSFNNRTIAKAYDIVQKAHDEAIAGARVGMRANEIDAIARTIIEKSEFSHLFIHGTGHGVGLDIHELPVISAKSETIIEEGMVFTIEPGIYLPERFGIRIEDMVVMHKGKAVVL